MFLSLEATRSIASQYDSDHPIPLDVPCTKLSNNKVLPLNDLASLRHTADPATANHDAAAASHIKFAEEQVNCPSVVKHVRMSSRLASVGSAGKAFLKGLVTDQDSDSELDELNPEYIKWEDRYAEVFHPAMPGGEASLENPPNLLNLNVHDKYVRFRYQTRHVDGHQLHLACLDKYSVALVQELLTRKAEVNSMCTSVGWGHTYKMPALHVAVGVGNLEIVQCLLNNQADCNARSIDCDVCEPRKHCTALHECAYFFQVQVAQALLKRKADVNATDADGATPLHWAAKRGNSNFNGSRSFSMSSAGKLVPSLSRSVSRNVKKSSTREGEWEMPLVELLLHFKADIHAETHRLGETPLNWALSHGRYPHRYLHKIMGMTLSELSVVAVESRRAAHRIIWDELADRIEPIWKAHLLKECRDANKALHVGENGPDTTKTWTKILGSAPKTAEIILDALTEEPQVKDAMDHPLPGRCLISGTINTAYTPSTKWALEGANQKAPAWQEELAPKAAARFTMSQQDWERVDIKMILLPNLINTDIVWALASTTHLQIFKNLGIQAIIDKCWDEFGHNYFIFDVIMSRLAEILMYALVGLYRKTKTIYDEDCSCRIT